MNAERIITRFSKDNTEDAAIEQLNAKRERLSEIVAGGGSKQYLGRGFQFSDINGKNPQQVEKLFCRYTAWLGANKTITLVFFIGLLCVCQNILT